MGGADEGIAARRGRGRFPLDPRQDLDGEREVDVANEIDLGEERDARGGLDAPLMGQERFTADSQVVGKVGEVLVLRDHHQRSAEAPFPRGQGRRGLGWCLGWWRRWIGGIGRVGGGILGVARRRVRIPRRITIGRGVAIGRVGWRPGRARNGRGRGGGGWGRRRGRRDAVGRLRPRGQVGEEKDATGEDRHGQASRAHGEPPAASARAATRAPMMRRISGARSVNDRSSGPR